MFLKANETCPSLHVVWLEIRLRRQNHSFGGHSKTTKNLNCGEPSPRNRFWLSCSIVIGVFDDNSDFIFCILSLVGLGNWKSHEMKNCNLTRGWPSRARSVLAKRWMSWSQLFVQILLLKTGRWGQRQHRFLDTVIVLSSDVFGAPDFHPQQNPLCTALTNPSINECERRLDV